MTEKPRVKFSKIIKINSKDIQVLLLLFPHLIYRSGPNTSLTESTIIQKYKTL